MGKTIGYSALALVAFMLLMFVLQAAGMVNYSFFGKWQEEIRHDIQTESTTYRLGLQRNLDSMFTQYQGADTAGKQGIIAAVRSQYSQVSQDQIAEYPAYLQDFLRTAGVY